MLLTLSMENKTDDVTYNYVALACRGFFQTSRTDGQLGPIIQHEMKGRLAPHEVMHFDIWYNIGYLQRRYSEDQIKARGGIRWCHILALSDVGDYTKRRRRLHILRIRSPLPI